MRTAVLSLGGVRLNCRLAVAPLEQQRGLEGYAPLSDFQGMYFPMPRIRTASFRMAGVTFPIDIIFFRSGHVAKIVGLVRPGDSSLWEYDMCSGVLEVRGGWARDHGLALGTPLLASL